MHDKMRERERELLDSDFSEFFVHVHVVFIYLTTFYFSQKGEWQTIRAFDH